MERLELALGDEMGQRNLIGWLEHPLTMLLLDAARELSRPVAPAGVDAHLGWLALGTTLGANGVVDFLANPTAGAEARRRAQIRPQPTYGAQDILKNQS
jgi:hypothetical protein